MIPLPPDTPCPCCACQAKRKAWSNPAYVEEPDRELVRRLHDDDSSDVRRHYVNTGKVLARKPVEE